MLMLLHNVSHKRPTHTFVVTHKIAKGKMDKKSGATFTDHITDCGWTVIYHFVMVRKFVITLLLISYWARMRKHFENGQQSTELWEKSAWAFFD